MVGNDVVTYYGPTLPIRALIFVDDVSGIGGVRTANNLIRNCNILEEAKKMTFNNANGKTEYLIIGNNKNENQIVTSEVKKGKIQRVKEHKMLGTWFDETGEYNASIIKKKQDLQYMISTVKHQASPRNVGVLTVKARLNLAEIVVIPSLLYNAEAFPYYTDKEIKKLESTHQALLTGILEVPISTPYYALLMETGWWTMRARLAYKKLMLYHNIQRSNDKRIIKRIVKIQKEEKRETTWYSGIQQEIKRYDIQLEVDDVLKSQWKKHVKEKITQKMEQDIRTMCRRMKKTRIVKKDEYKKKEYLGKLPLMQVRKILKVRMNMSKVPGNYKREGMETCPLCQRGEGSTEHYFECKRVRQLAKVWDVKKEDLESQNIHKMREVACFMEKVEIMLKPMMPKKSKKEE